MTFIWLLSFHESRGRGERRHFQDIPWNGLVGLVGGQVSYSLEPLDPPSQGNALICCSMPVTDIELDL